ncbi:head morphogenesis protein [Pelagibacterium lentulum]|uniref:Phage head morphogenesis domain-containing protein n=1 Tax=Pelagibacterium lentulum TaxID=2029865 RepID=A0A916W4G3_9HYPH|nr:head morphogenesis protein [Pelagibacterium lentulum]GGA64934.1 hypothetical protein GCM10011499_39230 [Pelagibacterium lentulum]
MARRPTRAQLRRQIRAIIDEFDPQAQAAFMDSVNEITSGIALAALVEALRARDVEAAVRALNIDGAAFTPLRRALEQAYYAGGAGTVAAMPTLRTVSGQQIALRFDVAFPRAEHRIRDLAGGFITRMTEEMRGLARTVIADGYALGRGPNTIAYDLAGRINRATGRRSGGILGLSGPQYEYVRTMREALANGPGIFRRPNGDPVFWIKRDGTLGTTLTRRDHRFDGTIIKAIREGKPVPADMVSRITGRYSDRLLLTRAEVVARTEVGEAVMASKREAFIQGLEKTGYTEQAVTRRWKHSGRRGKHARDQHIAMNNVEVKGLSEPYTLPDGTRMMHPLDSSLGAGPDQIVSCACDEEILLDFSEGVT